MPATPYMPAAMLLVALLAGCSAEPSAGDNALAEEGNLATEAPVGTPEPPAAAAGWEMLSSGEGSALFLPGEGEERQLTLFCSGKMLSVNVPVFEPIASEERLSLGSGGTVVALVADPAGDAQRGGVTGEGPVPAELAAILGQPEGVGISYGAQVLGPLPLVPEAAARDFVTACND